VTAGVVLLIGCAIGIAALFIGIFLIEIIHEPRKKK